MLTAWRIAKANRAASAFDGEGARLYGGRWNSPGVCIVYTAQSVSLAALELMVHLRHPPLLSAYCSIAAHFPSGLVSSVGSKRLPAGWQQFPASRELQEIGNRWAAERRSAVLKVPSAVVPSEFNYLLNPLHPDYSSIRIDAPVRFEFDPRLR